MNDSNKAGPWVDMPDCRRWAAIDAQLAALPPREGPAMAPGPAMLRWMAAADSAESPCCRWHGAGGTPGPCLIITPLELQSATGHPAPPSCPVCGGNEDPCPTCGAWAALTLELQEDLLWAEQFDRAGERRRIYHPGSRSWIIDGGPELVQLGLLELRHDGAGMTGLGLDVIHAIRGAIRVATSG